MYSQDNNYVDYLFFQIQHLILIKLKFRSTSLGCIHNRFFQSSAISTLQPKNAYKISREYCLVVSWKLDFTKYHHMANLISLRKTISHCVR
jgi:hypothetical protein